MALLERGDGNKRSRVNVSVIPAADGKTLKSRITEIGLENHASPLTVEFDVQLRKLLANIYKSRGSFRGRLEAVNIHSSPCVLHIYPVVGPSRIRCIYPKGRFPRIGEYLGQSVDVFGIVKFRGDYPHPYEIEAEEIVPLRERPAVAIADALVGSMPLITDSKDVVTFLHELRNG